VDEKLIEPQRRGDAERKMKTELTKLTELKFSEMNSENSVNPVFNSASPRLCGELKF
jgi:hypothetical protein